MLMVRVLDVSLPSLTMCCLSVRKLVIQLGVGMERLVSWSERSGMMIFGSRT